MVEFQKPALSASSCRAEYAHRPPSRCHTSRRTAAGTWRVDATTPRRGRGRFTSASLFRRSSFNSSASARLIIAAGSPFGI